MTQNTSKSHSSYNEFESFLFTHHTAPMLIIDPSYGQILDANSAAAEFYGWSQDQLRHMRIQEIDTLSEEQVFKVIEEARTLTQNNFNLKHRIADGSIRHVRVFVTKFDFQGSDLLHTIITDISEQKAEEEKLRRSEAKFRAIVENSNDGILFCDGNATITYRNPAYSRINDFTSEEQLDHSGFDILHPEDLQMLRERWNAMIVQPDSVLKAEYRIRHKDGTWRWVDTTAQNLLRNPDIASVVVTTRDITDRKLAEITVQQSDRHLHMIFETMTEGIALNEIIYDENQEMVDYRILRVNKAFYKIANFFGQEVIGKLATEIYGMTPDFIKEFWKQHKSRSVVAFTEMLSPIDNKWCFISTSPFVNNIFVTSFFDITERKLAEQALHKSQATLKAVIDSTSDLIWSVNATDFGLFTWNNAYTKYNREQRGIDIKIGMRPCDLFPPGSSFIQQWENYYSQALQKGYFSTEYTMSAGTRILELNLNSLRQNDTTFGISVFGKDITESKRAQMEILKNEARMESLLRISQHPTHNLQELLDFSLNEAIQLTQSKIGYIYFYDENTREFTLNTWSKEVMNQCTVAEKQTVYALDKTGIWGEAVRQRKSIMINDFAAPNPLKKWVPQGHAPLHRFLTIPVFYDNAIVAVVGVANKDQEYDDSDIRQLNLMMDSVWKIVLRRRTEEALRKSEARIVTGIQISGLCLYEEEGEDRANRRMTFQDDRMRKLLGIPISQEHRSRDYWIEHIHPEDLQDAMGMAIQKLENNRENIVSAEYRYHNEKQGWLWFRHVAYALHRNDKGDVLHLVGAVQDITERKKTEEALRNSQRFESLGLMAGGIAHDFNNILGGIVGYADMSKDCVPADSRISTYLDKILTSADRAKNLVNQILLFSRQRADSMNPMYIRPIVNEVIGLLRATLPSSIELKCDIAKDSRPIRANSTRIHEVIMNLCVNAAYAMKNKGTLEISHTELTLESELIGKAGIIQPGFYSVISVKDTGSGISPEILSKIFEPYFTTKPFGEGTGLGLAVVLGIVQSHQGNITVESAVGKGTEFKIYLPKSDDDPIGDERDESKIRGGNERILFIDDEIVLCEMIRDMLTGLGYKVTAYSDSFKALKEVRDVLNEYDLVITDQTMPKISGFELSKEFLNIRKDLPIILCTGFSKGLDESTILDAGISALCIKPISKAEIAKKIRMVLDEKSGDVLYD